MKLLLTLICTGALATMAARADTDAALGQQDVLMGYIDQGGDLSSAGTAHKGNGGPLSDLTDGNTTDSVDEYGEPNSSLNSNAYIGVIFSQPLTLQVTSVGYYASLFGDGGWFGKSGVGADGADDDFGAKLVASALITPTVQYTTDGGTTWTDVSNQTSNYLSVLTGVQTPNGGNVVPSTEITFNFAPIAIDSDIDGFRIIGENGGYADQGGFIAATEFLVEVPEPSTWALLFGGLALLVLAARFRATRA